MPEKKPSLSLSAVITEADGEFIVSVTMLSYGEEPTIVGEEVLATIDAAESYIEHLSSKMGYPPKKVKRLYSMADGKIRTRLPRGKKSV